VFTCIGSLVPAIIDAQPARESRTAALTIPRNPSFLIISPPPPADGQGRGWLGPSVDQE
jgi:hypothetical protein